MTPADHLTRQLAAMQRGDAVAAAREAALATLALRQFREPRQPVTLPQMEEVQ